MDDKGQSCARRDVKEPPWDVPLGLGCSDSRVSRWPTPCGRVSPPKESGQDLQESLEAWPRPSPENVARVKIHPYFFQNYRKAPWVLDDVSATSAATRGG